MNFKNRMEIEKKDFENRVKFAYIDDDNMLCLGLNKLHPNCPGATALREKYKHIDKLLLAIDK